MVSGTATDGREARRRADADRWRREFENRLRDRLRAVFGRGRWLITSEVTQASVGAATRLVAMTGRDPDDFVLALAGRHGVGDLGDSIRVFSLDVPEGDNMVEGIRLAHRALTDPPADVRARIDAWDPDLQARVIQPFTMSGETVAGRVAFGGRRPAWTALEDKLAILEVWNAAGVDQAPSRVVELASAGAVADAHRELAGPLGTVWSVDNDQGWHGGAVGTHWVRDEARADGLRAELRPRHRRVRVMPFLDGVPCSIHGMVVGGEIISFRPTEMLVYRDPERARLVYGRSATFWDPPAGSAEQMVAAVEAVGRELQHRIDFRGVFTLDGVAGSTLAGCEGFVPTEVNMRYGAALPAVLPTADGDTISLYFTNLAEVAGELRGHEFGISPGDLQRWVRDRLVETRGSRMMMATATGPAEGQPEATVWADRSPHPASGITGDTELRVEPSPPAHAPPASPVDGGSGPGPGSETGLGSEPGVRVASARWGTAGDGGVVFVELDGDTIPRGPAVAPQGLLLFRALDDHWGLGLPRLVAGGSPLPAPSRTGDRGS